MRLRHGLLGIVIIGLFVSLALARQGVVRTRNGRMLEGDVTDKGLDGVTIATKVGSVSIARDEVASIEYGANIEEAYKGRLAALPKTAGTREHFEIARWLYDSKAYALARQEVNTVLSLDPSHTAAVQLRQSIDREAAWEAAGKTGIEPKPGPGTGIRPPAGAGGGTVRDRKYLDLEQINQIRVGELKETDRSVRVRLDKNVEKRYTDYDSYDVREFAALTPFQKASQILKKGKADMRQDVRILTDPQSLADYKLRIQPMVLSGCATSNCHGGVNAGSFQLFNPATDDLATYTNFYILTQTSASTGEARRKMIDRTQPRNSLLAQFGLPRDRADSRHPEVQGLIPMFKGKDDPRYRIMLDWLENSLVAVEPSYGIDYVPPGSNAPTTQPALPVPSDPAKPPLPVPAKPAGAATDTQNKLDEARGRIRPGGL